MAKRLNKIESVFACEYGDGVLVHGASKNVLPNEIYFFCSFENSQTEREPITKAARERRRGSLVGALP